MLLILVSLAALWMMERNRRIEAQQQVGVLRSALVQFGAAQPGPGEAGGPQSRPAAGLPRADIISVRDVEWQGKARKLVAIPASVGQRLGFEPGDLVDVARQQPETSPAGRSR